LERIMACIPPTLEGWVYIIPIHGPLDVPLHTWAQYTPTVRCSSSHKHFTSEREPSVFRRLQIKVC